ncbi:hypothetical protein CB1_000339038 [Camelus ferus]|nr:hypothetical protein CB1_000339038 [Camelus ferus]
MLTLQQLPKLNAKKPNSIGDLLTLHFQLPAPELVLVLFVVEDYDSTSPSGFVGQFTLPLNSLKPGFRHIRLPCQGRGLTVISHALSTSVSSAAEGVADPPVVLQYAILLETAHLPETDLVVYDDCISQGVTDSYISVIGHEGQEDTFSTPKSEKEKHLGSTGNNCDILPSREKVYHHLWDSAADEGQVYERKLAEQKVHWSVEPQVHPYQKKQDEVPNYCDKVNQDDDVDKDTDILHIGEQS